MWKDLADVQSALDLWATMHVCAGQLEDGCLSYTCIWIAAYTCMDWYLCMYGQVLLHVGMGVLYAWMHMGAWTYCNR